MRSSLVWLGATILTWIAAPTYAQPVFSDYSGTFQCGALQAGADARTPQLRLNGATGEMTVVTNSRTSFSGFATRAYFGALSRVEYYLNWKAQSALIVSFDTRPGTRADTASAVLSLPDTMALFVCNR